MKHIAAENWDLIYCLVYDYTAEGYSVMKWADYLRRRFDYHFNNIGNKTKMIFYSEHKYECELHLNQLLHN